MPISYLTDTILPRDMWMHRLDVAVATEHEFVQTAEHDGRISALVVRELAGKLEPILGEQSVLCDLRGVTGGSWSIGAASEPSAGVVLDALDFHLLASERLTPKQLHERSLVTVTGEAGLAERFLENTVVLY